MEVLPGRSNASLEGLIDSSVGLHIISHEELRLMWLTKVSPKGLCVSLGGIRIKNHAYEV